ncbi:MAG: type II toxin-antitoxin system RelE/ParE family toxin [Candidatus Symbiobacter sp.]|nr:type II toxin-antitoxin system RelE/ParE family toxin [Candidatus Symbiobacter sp.]
MSGMSIWKEPAFTRFAQKNRISDDDLISCAQEIKNGLEGKNLTHPGDAVKVQIKRLARSGGGKSGGYRVVVLYDPNEFLIFMLGYARNEDVSISKSEKEFYLSLAKDLAFQSNAERNDVLRELNYEEIAHVHTIH